MRSISKSETGDDEGALKDIQEAIKLSKVDNELNRTYSAGAQSIGWPGGHTELYAARILDIQLQKSMPEELRQRRQEKNSKRRNTIKPGTPDS